MVVFDLNVLVSEYNYSELFATDKSLDMALALHELKEKLRSKLKYEEPKLNDLEDFQNFFFETLDEYGINLDDLII